MRLRKAGQLLEFVQRGAARQDAPRQRHPVCNRPGPTADVQGRARIQRHHVVRRARLAAQCLADQSQTLLRIRHLQAVQCGRRQVKLCRRNAVFGDFAVAQLGHPGGRRNGNFIQPVIRADHQRVLAAQLAKHRRHRREPLLCKHAHQLTARAGGVGQRAEQVENTAHANLPARADGMPHRRMMAGRKHEPDAAFVYAAANLLRGNRNIDAGGLEHVGAARVAGGGTAAVFRHTHPGGAGNQGAGGGDIEQAGAVTAGTDGVHHRPGLDLDPGRQLAHDHGGAGELLDCLALDGERHQEGADLRRRRLAAHDHLHHRLHLFARQAVAAGQAPIGGG